MLDTLMLILTFDKYFFIGR